MADGKEQKNSSKRPRKGVFKDPFGQLFASKSPKNSKSGKNGSGGNGNGDRNRLVAIAAVTLGFFLVLQFLIFPEIQMNRISYGQFYEMVERNLQTGEIVQAELVENVVRGKLVDGTYFQVNVPSTDVELIPTLRRNIVDFNVNPPKVFWRNLVYSVMPVLLLIGFFWFFVYRGSKQGGGPGGILSFGKSRAKMNDQSKNKVTFQDVAGVEEAKEELQEIIAFLKNPKKFTRLGGKIPKGVLLMGPPGTGKTLLAKAVAGEAEVPFYSMSGSDFVEMFVGVGASRVRDLFEQARKAAEKIQKGAIIFIDELDAVGRQRFAGLGGGHDEREQTLNALLTEMDGFSSGTGVILIGATNRPDVLDSALLRPGRFDRQVVVDRPDLNGRADILKVHMRGVKVDESTDLQKLARRTPGFSGADLANLVNEGALLAARRDKPKVTQKEFEEAIERVVAGPERKSRVILPKEKEVVAVHESGHTLLTLLLKGADPLHKVSIIPRGASALGYTMQMPDEDRYLKTKQELIDKMTVLMGGRVAEEITFGEVTTGAQNDLEVATGYAKRMVCEFGMSEKLGNIAFSSQDKQVFLGRDFGHDKDYSEETAKIIDGEVRKFVNDCYARATQLITENLDKLQKLSKVLLEKEVMDSEEVRELLGMKSEKPPEEPPPVADVPAEPDTPAGPEGSPIISPTPPVTPPSGGLVTS